MVHRSTGETRDAALAIGQALAADADALRDRLAECEEERLRMAAEVDVARQQAQHDCDAAQRGRIEAECMRDQLRAQLAELQQAHDAALAASAGAAAAAPVPADPATVDQRLREVYAAHDQLEREVRRWKRLYEEESARRLQEQAAGEESLRKAHEDLIEMRRRIEDVQAQVRAAEAVSAAAVAPSPGEPGRLDAPALADMVRRLTRNYNLMTAQAEQSAEALEKARAQIAQLETRVAGAGPSAVDAAVVAQDELQKKYEALETEHRGVLREFRDLNDRHLRLVQAQAAGKK